MQWILLYVISTAVASSPVPAPKPCRTTMPAQLQWWERHEVSPIAKALRRPGKLQKFHALLERHVKIRRHMIPGTPTAFDMVMKTYREVDAFIQYELLQRYPVRTHEATWVTVIVAIYGGLRPLHAFLGRYPRPAAVDRYLKRMVRNHGGPLIDRRWNCPGRACHYLRLWCGGKP